MLESKDGIRERLGASPDIADALALTFAAPVGVADRFAGCRAEPRRDAHGLLYGWHDETI